MAPGRRFLKRILTPSMCSADFFPSRFLPARPGSHPFVFAAVMLSQNIELNPLRRTYGQ